MNLAEHPIAIDIDNRLAEARAAQGSAPGSSDDVFLITTVLFPGLPNLMGQLRKTRPGLYTLTTNIKLEGGPGGPTQQGLVDFSVVPDKVVTIIWPSEHVPAEPSRIVSPH